MPRLPTSAAPTIAIPQRRRRTTGSASSAASSSFIDGNRASGPTERPRNTTRRTQPGTRERSGGGRIRPSATFTPRDKTVVALERPLAVQGLVQRDAEAELIGPRIGESAREIVRAPCRPAFRSAPRFSSAWPCHARRARRPGPGARRRPRIPDPVRIAKPGPAAATAPSFASPRSWGASSTCRARPKSMTRTSPFFAA